MKIVHICLSCFYVDGMGYQENILPKYHAEDNDVFIITSDFAFDSLGQKIKKTKKEYYNEYGILVKVLDKSHRYGFYSRYNDYKDLYKTLCELNPDIIFCHGGQFVALKDVIKYCKKNSKVKLFIDQHGDYYNTPVDSLRKRLGQSLIYGYWMRKAQKYTSMFWGVTPWRCDYLSDVYGIRKDKIALLPMGGDDEKINFSDQKNISSKIRKEFNISENDLLIVTGGKINSEKRIDVLMQAVAELDLDNLKLLVFGQANENIAPQIQSLSQNRNIRYIGWIPADDVYNYFLASDLAVFPGTHSVLWEQACACGVPCVFRDWKGMHHVDVGGNAVFIQQGSKEEMISVLKELYFNRDNLSKMKSIAVNKAVPMFSYRRIAQKSIFEEQ